MTRRLLARILSLLFASLLFYLSHPNALFPEGLAPLGFVALVPVFLLVPRTRLRFAWLYGAAYGVVAYGLFCSWLADFHPYTIYLICALYAVFVALVFLAMRASCLAFRGRLRFLGMALVWLSFEYLKTLGFAGFQYGILGYTQWKNPFMLSLSSVGGVWAVSAVCVAFSALTACAADGFFRVLRECVLFVRSGERRKALKAAAVPVLAPLCAAAALLALSVSAGAAIRPKGVEQSRTTVSFVAVQNNSDPWKGGVEQYKANVATLFRLTGKALELHPGADFVVWPETAVVPPIVRNYSTRHDYERYQLVLSVLSYFDESGRCFIVGNQHSVDTGGTYTDDYNAALVFDPSVRSAIPPEPEVYGKQHLVPFTEWFPYEKLFPRLYRALLLGDTHLWTPGTEVTVFRKRGVSFATPICFEDTFADGCRRFVAEGAELLVNLSNDAWAHSLPCQMQHLSMATFRSAENRVPSVRSTASGMTCIIGADGLIAAEAEPFSEAWLYGEVSVPSERRMTFYTRHGDWLAHLWLSLLFLYALSALISAFLERKDRGVPCPPGMQRGSGDGSPPES